MTAALCRARHRSTMAQTHRVCGRGDGPFPRRRRHARDREFGQDRVSRSFVIIAALLFLCTDTAAHPPDAEFADWFRSLKEPARKERRAASSHAVHRRTIVN